MLDKLINEVRQCKVCDPDLALGARPIIQAGTESRLLIIGQAPGVKAHNTNMPWSDPSGDRLRKWLYQPE